MAITEVHPMAGGAGRSYRAASSEADGGSEAGRRTAALGGRVRGRRHYLNKTTMGAKIMMNKNQTLAGKKVAILVTDGFEQEELAGPRTALEAAEAVTEIVAPKDDTVRAWKESDFGDNFDVDVPLRRADPANYDALLLPGGVMNPDHLRMEPAAVEFVRRMFDAGKPVAAICHGPQMLIEAGVVRGRRLTSYPSLQTDLRNAGAEWLDEPVVTDRGLVTSRRPADIPQFNEKMIEEIAEGVHARE
ncbi:MAG TPA: type 1 glutamine amidotransferase domain-containing protein [Opitutus sp.]|nr:type 1 glutamine amidotransferase domain-containing protein [Opitutus sp.]